MISILGKTKRIHMIGIGGVGMSGIAEVLTKMGFEVSGSDLNSSENTERLAKLGVKVSIGHAEENLTEADVVVVSAAIGEDNPELRAAKSRKIPIISRAEMLSELMKRKFSIAVGGTHGKTTTTAMTASVLSEGGLDPTVINGGVMLDLQSNARLGKSQFMVVEADEAYGSIKRFFPTISVVTSIDFDHMDYYENLSKTSEAFLEFINRVPFYGAAILCADELNIKALLPKVERRAIRYGLGFEANADLIASKLGWQETRNRLSYEVSFKEKRLGEINLPMIGKHNVYNSLAALAVGIELGIGFDLIKRALENYKGVERRFEVIGEVNGILIVDDYAHNPTKLKATFSAIKESYGSRRVIAVFQPHRYSRVQTLAEQFAKSFDRLNQTDRLLVTEIYGAGEEPIAGVSSRLLVDLIKNQGCDSVIYIADKEQIAEHLLKIVKPNDLVITLGAGDIWKGGRELLEKLTRG